MPLARRSRVAETGGASPADVVSPWRGLSPYQRLTLEPVPVGYSGLPPSQSASLRLLIFMRAPRSTRRTGPSRREPDVEIVYERVAGIDVGKKIIAVAVRTPGEHPGKRRQQVRKYNTFYQTLTEMVAWLVSEGVTHVTMEATGIYWRPVFHALCAAERAAGGVVGQRPACQERPGSQERCPRRGVAGGVDRVRAAAGQLHPATADRRDPGADPLPQEAHRAAHQRAAAPGARSSRTAGSKSTRWPRR